LEGKPAQGGMAPAGAPATTPAPASATPEAPAAEAKPLPSDVFYLQVGAFQKAADADNLKAKLALTGLYASVQEVVIADKGTMHRVRVGPFRDPDEMNRARALLAQNSVQASVVKQKE
nr:SPOR domain-containing protein [Sulfuritalea sp.]